MKDGRVGYAVVGAGHIAQSEVLPAFVNAENSRLAAIVSGGREKREALGRRYGVPTWDYDGFEECLASPDVDAVYLAVPNNLHCGYTARAARAGVHVLCEKPMALSEDECRRMIGACDEAGVRLMIAYRLHFEPANLYVVERLRQGSIGDVRYFTSEFSFQVAPGNIRTRPGLGGGPLWDIGIYCLNAARYLLRDEPAEAFAYGAGRPGDDRFDGIEETAAVLLRFPGDRLATFVCSFGTESVDSFRVVGERGEVRVENPYSHGGERVVREIVEGRTSEKWFAEVDQFGPELVAFSDAILNGRELEPDGWEGLADVRIIEAIHRSVAAHQPVAIEPVPRTRRPEPHQRIVRPAVREPPLVEVQAPHQ